MSESGVLEARTACPSMCSSRLFALDGERRCRRRSVSAIFMLSIRRRTRLIVS